MFTGGTILILTHSFLRGSPKCLTQGGLKLRESSNYHFHLLKHISYFALLAVKGIYHYWKISTWTAARAWNMMCFSPSAVISSSTFAGASKSCTAKSWARTTLRRVPNRAPFFPRNKTTRRPPSYPWKMNILGQQSPIYATATVGHDQCSHWFWFAGPCSKDRFSGVNHRSFQSNRPFFFWILDTFPSERRIPGKTGAVLPRLDWL